jgi:hypothetical protein
MAKPPPHLTLQSILQDIQGGLTLLFYSGEGVHHMGTRNHAKWSHGVPVGSWGNLTPGDPITEYS